MLQTSEISALLGYGELVWIALEHQRDGDDHRYCAEQLDETIVVHSTDQLATY